jgi:hypothetical protein
VGSLLAAPPPKGCTLIHCMPARCCAPGPHRPIKPACDACMQNPASRFPRRPQCAARARAACTWCLIRSTAPTRSSSTTCASCARTRWGGQRGVAGRGGSLPPPLLRDAKRATHPHSPPGCGQRSGRVETGLLLMCRAPLPPAGHPHCGRGRAGWGEGAGQDAATLPPVGWGGWWEQSPQGCQTPGSVHT